jgi:hypothetical protein
MLMKWALLPAPNASLATKQIQGKNQVLADAKPARAATTA